MIGGLFKSASRVALVAAAGVLVGGVSAQAADLGGNCCADLEERVAELEATTARKGNRKVSLTVYGQVNWAVMYWDDGHETNAYVVDNNNSRSVAVAPRASAAASPRTSAPSSRLRSSSSTRERRRTSRCTSVTSGSSSVSAASVAVRSAERASKEAR